MQKLLEGFKNRTRAYNTFLGALLDSLFVLHFFRKSQGGPRGKQRLLFKWHYLVCLGRETRSKGEEKHPEADVLEEGK